MCGRYTLTSPEELGQRYDKPMGKEVYLGPNYNVAPTNEMPVVLRDSIESMKWGLIPPWSKDFVSSFSTINARSETVAEKPMYRSSFKSKRCIVPASGFYEWLMSEDGKKQPFYFTRTDGGLLSFAGLYSIWKSPEGEDKYSYTIITTGANKWMSDIHDRMPVIFEKDEEELWLSDEEKPDELQLMLDAADERLLHRFEVSREVNVVKNEGEGLIAPLNSK